MWFCCRSSARETGAGRQRWLCQDCGYAFSWKNRSLKRYRQQVWFRRRVVEGYSVRQLAAQSGHSPKTLRALSITVWKILPTRGNIHDMSGAITHKREIITLYLEGYLTPEIAVRTHHPKESVDRYIKDFHRVKLLWEHGIHSIDDIAQIARLAKRVVQQYVDLLPEKSLNRTHLSKSKTEK